MPLATFPEGSSSGRGGIEPEREHAERGQTEIARRKLHGRDGAVAKEPLEWPGLEQRVGAAQGHRLRVTHVTASAEGADCFVNLLTALGMIETMRREGHKALVRIEDSAESPTLDRAARPAGAPRAAVELRPR